MWLLFAKQSLDVGRSARIPGPLEGYPPANPGNVRPPQPCSNMDGTIVIVAVDTGIVITGAPL